MFSSLIKLKVKLLHLLLKKSGFENVNQHLIFEKGLGHNPLVIDLGANRGGFSLQMEEKYGADCFAIEPNKTLFEQIKMSASHKFNMAVSNKDGQIDLHISENDEASSTLKGFQQIWAEQSIQKVEAVSWRTLIERLPGLKQGRVDVLKVDVEGAELDLIDSLTIEDLKTVRQISVEFHDWLNWELHDRTKSSIKHLCSLGFKFISNSPSHRYPLEALFLCPELAVKPSLKSIWFRLFEKFTFIRY